MNKEEILMKSRQEKKDEGKEYIYNSGRRSGVIGMLLIFSVLSVYYLYTANADRLFPLLSIMFGYLCFESLGIFRVSNKKTELIKVFIGTILCVCFLAASFH